VLFTSTDQLTGADKDASARDVYAHEAGAIQLISPGAAGGGDAGYLGRSPTGSRVFFTSGEQLATGDQDGGDDVYESRLGTVAPPAADTTPPAASLGGKSVQKNNGKVKVTVTCGPSEACRLKASGTLKAGGKKYTLGGTSANVAAKGKVTLKLKVPKPAKKAAAAALSGGKKVKGSVVVVVSDAAGNKRTLTFKVKLK